MNENPDSNSYETNDGTAVWLWTIALLVIIAIGILVVAINQPKSPTTPPSTPSASSLTT
ncbi:MAG: hypothetical protein AAB647_00040 [Patescibacteria group bacterium]